MNSYECKHFGIKELVHPDTYSDRGEASWQLIDVKLVITIDQLREKFGPTTINDWSWGGGYTLSGLRPQDTDVGATYSQHKYGRAADCKFKDVSVQEAYAYILDHPNEFPHITTVENIDHTPTWLHVDVRYTGQHDILIVNP